MSWTAGRTAVAVAAAAGVVVAAVMYRSAPPGPAEDSETAGAGVHSPVDEASSSNGVAARTRIVPTSLIGLEISAFDLSGLIPGDHRASGALAAIDDDHLIVVDGDGHFFDVTTSNDHAPRIVPLRTHLTLNVDLHRQQVAEVRQGIGFPVRVSDLHYDPSGEMFAAYTFWHPFRRCYTTRVASIAIEALRGEADASRSWRVRYEHPPCIREPSTLEAGGRIWLTSHETLLLTLGDFSQFPDDLRRHDLASILSIDLETGESVVVSRGHRNSQGLTIDTRGRIWSTEHGPLGGDELNEILLGRDYGWPSVSYGTDYGARELFMSNQQGRHEGFEKPRYVWVPSVGITNLIVLDGFHERWNGDILALSLAAGALHRLRLDDRHVILEERLPIGGRPRDLVQMPNGAIYVWSDQPELLRILPVDPGVPIRDRVARLDPPVRDALLQCTRCHDLDAPSDRGTRISLVGIYKERPARGADHLFSPALRAMRSEDVWWDDEHLDRFLARPEDVVEGTTMTFRVEDEWTRRQVIEFLKSLP